MAHWRRVVLGLVWAGLLVDCGGKKGLTSFDRGELFVAAFDAKSQPLANVHVSTDPETKDGFTDEFGSVLLDQIPVGTYRVLGERDLQHASSSARVTAGETTQVDLLFGRIGGTDGEGNSSGGATGSSGGRPSTGRGGATSAGGGSARGGATGMGGSDTLPYIDVATQVGALVADPERHYLYALDSVNNNMLFINLDSNQVEKTIFVGSKPVDLDFDAANKNAYVANWGSTEIAVVDLEAQKVARSVFVDTTLGTWEGNPYRLAVTAGDTLVFTEEDQWCDLKLVNSTTGVNIAVAGSLYQPDLAVTKDRGTLYVGESGSSGSALTRFSVDSSGLTQVDASGEAGYAGGRVVALSGDDKYVFFSGQKYLATNLKSILGKFSEAIYASNADGSVVVGNKSVFNGNNFAITAVLPISTTVLAMSPDGKTLYLYDTATSRIYIYDI